jgi:lipoprotein signal peptidase
MDPTLNNHDAAPAPDNAPAPTGASDQQPAAQPVPVPGDEPAWRYPCSLAILLITAIVGLTADLVTKYLAFEHLRWHRPNILIPNLLSLDLSLNLGALFGIGKGLSLLFILASVLAVGFVAYMFATSQRKQWVVHMALGLVLGGALGNLYDRLFVKVSLVTPATAAPGTPPFMGTITPVEENDTFRLGDYPHGRTNVRVFRDNAKVETRTAVRDFIRVDASFRNREVWPWIFNIADSMLVVGVGLLLVIYWRHPVAPRSASPLKQQ